MQPDSVVVCEAGGCETGPPETKSHLQTMLGELCIVVDAGPFLEFEILPDATRMGPRRRFAMGDIGKCRAPQSRGEAKFARGIQNREVLFSPLI